MPVPPCNGKKLNEGLCPKCNQQVEDGRERLCVTSTLSIQIDESLLLYRGFDTVIKSFFEHIKEQLPQEAEDIEDLILDNLPKQCNFNVGYGTNSNVIANISFELQLPNFH